MSIKPRISDILRETVSNSAILHTQIADYIDELETKVASLTLELENLTQLTEKEIDDLK